MKDLQKISSESFNEMLKMAMNENNHLRVGQSFFVILHECYPDIAVRITGTKYDPFYVDENLYELFKLIVENV